MSSNASQRGRTVGRDFAPYRSRVLDGDIMELARIIMNNREDIWT